MYVGQTECSGAQRLQVLSRISGERWLVETGTDASADVALTINSPSPKRVLALLMRAGNIASENSDSLRVLFSCLVFLSVSVQLKF